MTMADEIYRLTHSAKEIDEAVDSISEISSKLQEILNSLSSLEERTAALEGDT